MGLRLCLALVSSFERLYLDFCRSDWLVQCISGFSIGFYSGPLIIARCMAVLRHRGKLCGLSAYGVACFPGQEN